VVRWRLSDLAEWVMETYGASISEQTLSRYLRAMGYRRLSARPRHHAQNPDTVATFKTYGPPRPQAAFASDLTGLRQRIRSRGRAPAKMEFRAPWPS
jgi:hypothetical protein